VAILQLDALGRFAESANAKIVVPFESAAMLAPRKPSAASSAPSPPPPRPLGNREDRGHGRGIVHSTDRRREGEQW
jgi:hypothetical protein